MNNQYQGMLGAGIMGGTLNEVGTVSSQQAQYYAGEGPSAPKPEPMSVKERLKALEQTQAAVMQQVAQLAAMLNELGRQVG